MENRNILKRTDKILAFLGVIVLSAFMRMLPHPPNMAPIAGLALFSGVFIGGPLAFVLPLASMLLSDLVLGFHSAMFYVYGSFLLIVILGKLLGKKQNAGKLVLAALSSSLLFFVITNFGVWASSNMYPHNFAGLLDAYIMGLPFLRNTVIGDLFYTFVLFYGYSFLTKFADRLVLQFTKAFQD